MYANRLTPSRDIAHGFSMMEYLHTLCSGGLYDVSSW